MHIVVWQAMFLATGLVLIIDVVRHAAGCMGGEGMNGEVLRRKALEHRLESLEKEVHENSQVLHKFLMSLETQFGVSELIDLRELKRECHDLAQGIVANIADSPAPPMPSFDTLDSFQSKDDQLADDDIFEGHAKFDDRYGALGDIPNEGFEEQSHLGDDVFGEQADLPSTEERSATCREWRSTYGVSPGVSWGQLPLELQNKWRRYDCDIYLQDSVQGMLDHKDIGQRPRSQDHDDDFNVIGDIASSSEQDLLRDKEGLADKGWW
uniref:Uncharacterized protein n=1 Tax=Aureoumbra lagunensis TaxID=44058 RepID=A0A7S3NPI7_9STRA